MPADRQVIVEMETSHLHPDYGGRIIALDLVELTGGVRSGKRFTSYFNPDREVDHDMLNEIGISPEALERAPYFFEHHREVSKLLKDASIILLGVFADIAFLDHELQQAESDYGPVTISNPIIDLWSFCRLCEPLITLHDIDSNLAAWSAEFNEEVPEPGSCHFYADRTYILYRKIKSLKLAL